MHLVRSSIKPASKTPKTLSCLKNCYAGKSDEEYLDVSEYLQDEGPEQIAFIPTLSQVKATWGSYI